MTPEERSLVTGLFDRLAEVGDTERDPEAERAIGEGLRRAPNAVYALVQTALVQDEALKRADARIRDLEAQLGEEPQRPRSGSFLGSMRDASGRRGSVPAPRPSDPPEVAPADYRSPPSPISAGDSRKSSAQINSNINKTEAVTRKTPFQPMPLEINAPMNRRAAASPNK